MKSIPPWVWLVGAAAYFVCPLDFDFIPGIGWLDDLAVAGFAIKQFLAAGKTSTIERADKPAAPSAPNVVLDAVRVEPSKTGHPI